MELSEWLETSRRAAARVRTAVESLSDRAEELGEGEGGDTTLAVDRAAEDTVLAELEATGSGLTVVTEERGLVELNGGGPPYVIVDPIDGSLNAKRGLPLFSLSIAVAPGDRLDEVEFGFVADLTAGTEWYAGRGEGAWRDGTRLTALQPGPLELLGLETVRAALLAQHVEAIAGSEARRVRVLGSVALSLCLVADGRLDAMLSLRAVRSVDVAAGALMVREAGGAFALPEAGSAAGLDLGMRSRAFGARDEQLLERLLAAF